MDYIVILCIIIFFFWEVDKVWFGKIYICICIWLEYFEYRLVLKVLYVYGKIIWVIRRLLKYRFLLKLLCFCLR